MCSSAAPMAMSAGNCSTPTIPSCPVRVPCVPVSGRRCPLMPRPSLSHPVCFQSPCAHRCVRGWLQYVVRGRQLRSGRVLRIRAASLVQLVGLVAVGSFGCVLLVPFYHRRGPLGVDFELDKAGDQRVLECRCAASSGLVELDVYVSCTACWSQVEWRPCAHVASDGVRHLVRALVRACNVTDVTSYTGHHRVMVDQSDSYPRCTDPLAII